MYYYTECENGTFGENCSMTCNCKSGGCNKESGECRVPGCVAGFIGMTCSTGKLPYLITSTQVNVHIYINV